MSRLKFPTAKFPHPPVVHFKSGHPTTDDYERAEGVVDILSLVGAFALGAVMAWGLLTTIGYAPWY